MDTRSTGSSPPSALAGAADGLAATVVMSGVMLAARRAGLTGALPPRRITTALLRRARARPTPRPAKDALSTVTHLAFGAAAGSLFEVVSRRWGGGGAAAGAAFGAAVWLVSYAGWIPALDLLPPPHRDRPGRPASMLAAHLVYGAVLGALAERRTTRARERATEAWMGSGI